MRTNSYRQIIDMLPSSLRAEIEACGYTVPEMDLLRIVYLHAGSFAEQLAYFHVLQEEGDTEEVRANARLMREHLEQAFSDFKCGAANVVYELCIKDTPDSYEEKYLCATLEAALGAIPLYYELYPGIAKESPQSRYRIVKRKVFDAAGPLDEDTVSECEYRAGGVLYRIYDSNAVVCDERGDIICEDCKKICLSRVGVNPCLPKYLRDGDVVAYYQHGKKVFGYDIDLDLYNHADLPKDPSFASEYYIIPLYENGGDYSSRELFNMHHHVTAGLVERANLCDLSKRQAEEAEMIRSFLRGNMNRNEA